MSLKNLGNISTAIKEVTSITTLIAQGQSAESNFNKVKESLNSVSTEAILASSSLMGLDATQTACLLSAKGLNSAQIASQMITSGYTKENIEAALATLGLSDAEIQATFSTSAFSAAEAGATVATTTFTASIKAATKGLITFLTTNPVGWAILAAGAIASVAAILDATTTSFKEAQEKSIEARQAYQDVASEVESLNSELETTKSRLEELRKLDAQGSLSPIEQKELADLELANARLERQLEIKTKLAAFKQNEAAEAANEVLTKQQNYTGVAFDYSAFGNEDGHYYMDIISITEELQSQIKEAQTAYDNLETEFANAVAEGLTPDDKQYKQYEKQLKTYQNIIDSMEEEITSNLSIISEEYDSLFDADGNILSGFESIVERINKVVDDATETTEEASDATSELTDEQKEAAKVVAKHSAAVSELKTELADFSTYQTNVNEALESSISATGLTAEQIQNLTDAYKDLDNFDASKLFEETANGVHLNAEELNRLNEELESNKLAEFNSEIRNLQKDIYSQRAKGFDTSALEADLETARQAKLEYEGLTSAYNKWLIAKSASNERDSYEGIGSSYKEMKSTLEQGWYGDESLNKYLDLILSASQRTGDAQKDFEKLNQTISGTSHSIMDYWQYDDDELVTDGLFDFLDDVNKKFGDSYATIGEDGKYAFDFTGDKLQEVADAFGISTQMVELFERAMIDAGMAIDMGDLTLPEQISKAAESLKEFQESGVLSSSLDLDFNFDEDPLEELKSDIDSLKEERVKIDAETNPEAAKELDDLIALCEEQYYFRLNAETDGGLDEAASIVEQLKIAKSITDSPISAEIRVQNEQAIINLATRLAELPPEVQTAVGINTENLGNLDGIIQQLNSAPESINVPVNYQPNAVADATGVANFILGESPLEVPDATGTANFKLGNYPKKLPSLTQTIYANKVGFSAGTAHAEGTVLNAHANGRNWALSKNEEALVNELGTESIVRDGKWHLIPGGAHIEKLKRGDIIFSASQTKELLKTGKVTSGGGHGRVAFSDGTLNAYDSGTGGNRRPGSSSTAYTNSSYTAPKSSSFSKTSSAESDDEIEKLDWIEVALNRISEAIDRLKVKAESAYKALSTRSVALSDEITMVTEQINLQEKAYVRYMKEANSVGLSSDLAELVRNGAVDISEYDEKTRELIKDYEEWYNKAIEASDAIGELHDELASLYEDNFNNIQDDFENQIELLEHLTNSYDTSIEALEAKGYLESTKYYAALQDAQKQIIEVLNKELINLEKSFSEAMNSGEIEEGSESYYEMQLAINGVKEEIDDANVSLLEYVKNMREVEWGYFDFIQERISQLTSESDFLIDLMSNSDLHNDKGQLSDMGMATMGLHAQNYNVYMAQMEQYAEELQNIQKQMANDPYNTEIIERREELLELQQDSILAAEDEKQAIVDLVREGIDIELDALKELIDAYTESLDSARDLYDFQNKIADQTSEIASLQKQLSAYENDLSGETRAKVQQLRVELSEAEQNLEEALYDKYIEDSKKLLDEIYSEYELILNQRLDNVEALISDMIETVNINTDSINETLINAADNAGYTMTDNMQSIWNGATDAINGTLSVYGDGFSEKLTAINNVLSQIQVNTSALIGTSDTEAEDTISSTTTTTTPTPSVNTPVQTTPVNPPVDTPIISNDISVGGKINAGNAKIYDYAGDTSGERQYFSSDPIYKVLDEKNGYLKVRWHKLSSGVTGWFKKNDVKAYKTGGLVDYTGLAQLDGTPSKPELVLNAKDTENFIALKETLQKLSQQELTIGDPSIYSTNAISHIGGLIDTSSMLSTIRNQQRIDTSTNIGDINITIPIDRVDDYNDFVNQLKNDKKFEKFLQAVTIDLAAGKSPFAKNKYNW